MSTTKQKANNQTKSKIEQNRNEYTIRINFFTILGQSAFIIGILGGIMFCIKLGVPITAYNRVRAYQSKDVRVFPAQVQGPIWCPCSNVILSHVNIISPQTSSLRSAVWREEKFGEPELHLTSFSWRRWRERLLGLTTPILCYASS